MLIFFNLSYFLFRNISKVFNFSLDIPKYFVVKQKVLLL